MKVDFSEMDGEFAGMLERKEHEKFLVNMRHLVFQLETNPDLKGKALFVPSLDAQMQSFAEQVRLPMPEKSNDFIVHVATEIYTTGGHTRIMEDIVRALPEYRHILILTDAIHNYSSGRMPRDQLKERFDNIGLEALHLTSTTLADKANELVRMIHDFAPRAVYLLGHLFDPVANAVSGKSAPHVFFVHHGDSLPCLGAARLDYTHVDLNPGCYPFCKALGGVEPLFLGMTVRDRSVIDLNKRRMGIIVTCGAPEKFAGKREFSYGEILATLFSNGIRVVHIGSMSDQQKEQIANEIREAGQEPQHIHFVENVPSLSRMLLDISPEFFLCSYPVGGGKAMLEAMSIGLPILAPRAQSTPPLICVDMSLGNAVEAKTLAEIPAALQKIRNEGNAIGMRNREIYEQQYSMGAFRQKLLKAMGITPW